MQVVREVDALFIFLTVLAAFFFFLTQGLLIYFALKYRRNKGEEASETPDITDHTLLESIWIIIPSIVVLIVFIYGYKVYRDLTNPIPGATEINVVAKQWLWQFKYNDGRTVINKLRVPLGTPIRLIMTSDDVIHSFFIPDYRIKTDVLPGRFTEIWLTPDELGSHYIVCAEFCGTGHSKMNGELIIMKREDYDKWAAGSEDKPGQPLHEKGKELVEATGCMSCHSIDGKKKIGPTLKGLFGRATKLEDGSTVTADEDYIMESIIDPKAKMVAGFKPVMPTFKETLGRDDVTAIIAYIKVLSGKTPPDTPTPDKPAPDKPVPDKPAQEMPGMVLLEENGCNACHTIDGSVMVGPSFKGIFGRETKLADGTTVKADEAYIIESILNPEAKIVDGYDPMMPPFEGVIEKEDISKIISYIKTLKDEEKPTEHKSDKPDMDKPADDKPDKPTTDKGATLLEENGCNACHTIDGTVLVGPSFKGIFGRDTKLADGKTVKADEAYISESILDPEAKMVEGYDPMMPPFEDVLSNEDIKAVIEYMKSLK